MTATVTAPERDVPPGLKFASRPCRLCGGELLVAVSDGGAKVVLDGIPFRTGDLPAAGRWRLRQQYQEGEASLHAVPSDPEDPLSYAEHFDTCPHYDGDRRRPSASPAVVARRDWHAARSSS